MLTLPWAEEADNPPPALRDRGVRQALLPKPALPAGPASPSLHREDPVLISAYRMSNFIENIFSNKIREIIIKISYFKMYRNYI